jgi:hypothetical protein
MRDVTPADFADVVADPRRATVTFVEDGEPAIVPVRARREGIAGASPPLRLRSTTARSSCCSTMGCSCSSHDFGTGRNDGQ